MGSPPAGRAHSLQDASAAFTGAGGPSDSSLKKPAWEGQAEGEAGGRRGASCSQRWAVLTCRGGGAGLGDDQRPQVPENVLGTRSQSQEGEPACVGENLCALWKGREEQRPGVAGSSLDWRIKASRSPPSPP